jgi:hypothetical protein
MIGAFPRPPSGLDKTNRPFYTGLNYRTTWFDSAKMDIIKTFLGHLYFSLCCTGIVFLILYGLVSEIDSSFSPVAEFYYVTGAFVGASAGFAGFLTYLTIKKRPKNHIVYTRREQ